MENKEDNVISSIDYAKILKDTPEAPTTKFKMPMFDSYTGGFMGGDLVAITGYTGHGKTTLSQLFTKNIAEQGIKLMWYSYEVTPRKFLNKFSKLPLFYLPKKKSSGFEWLANSMREAKKKHGIKVVFIDHLHYIVDMMPTNNVRQDMIIGSMCRNLKQFAIDEDMTIFLIVHTGQPRDDSPPTLGSIRDSSFIGQEADAVYAINRARQRGQGGDMYKAESDLIILKQRETGTMGKKVKLIYKDGMLQEEIPEDIERSLEA